MYAGMAPTPNINFERCCDFNLDTAECELSPTNITVNSQEIRDEIERRVEYFEQVTLPEREDPNIPIHVDFRLEDMMDNLPMEEMEEDADLPFYMTPQGLVYGFADKQGNVYLDRTIISPQHPIHEYTHLWDRVIQSKKPELWKRGVELMKQTVEWLRVENDANYGKKWKEKGITGERLENLIASEVHSRFVGEGGEVLMKKLAKQKGMKGIISKLRDWMVTRRPC